MKAKPIRCGDSEDRFRALLDAMVIVDNAGVIVLVNAQTEKLFGYDRQELIGQPVEMLIPSRFRQSHPDHRARFFSNPHARGMRLSLRGRYGLSGLESTRA